MHALWQSVMRLCGVSAAACGVLDTECCPWVAPSGAGGCSACAVAVSDAIRDFVQADNDFTNCGLRTL